MSTLFERVIALERKYPDWMVWQVCRGELWCARHRLKVLPTGTVYAGSDEELDAKLAAIQEGKPVPAGLT